MSKQNAVKFFQPGTLVITPGDREDIVMAAISRAVKGPAIAGLILTNGSTPTPALRQHIAQSRIPVITAPEESYAIASKIHDMTVKTQPQDTDKIPVIKRMITENVDLKRLLAAC